MDRLATTVGALALLCTLTGCPDDLVTGLSFAVPTEVAVDPQDFLGDTSCSVQPGAMRSYVVTISAFEDEADNTAFIVGSTRATPCSLIAGFREIVILDQIHTAEIDGYDVPPERLVPFGGASSGSRQMLDVDTGEVVTPRWTASCGTSGADGIIAQSSRRVFVRPCTELVDAAPTPTQLVIGPSNVLGDNACEVAPSFDVTPEGSDLPAATGIPCDAGPLTYDVEPNTTYALYATSTIDGVAFGSECTATAINGVAVSAKCNPLSATGQATISLGGVTSGDEDLCPVGSFFDVFDGETVLNTLPIPCANSTRVGPFNPGLTLFDIVVYGSGGTTAGMGSCGADIIAGRTTSALCVSDG